MPGHVIPPEVLRERVFAALEVGVANAQIEVRDAASYLAPKRTDELAATIEARKPTRYANGVRGRVVTTEPYAIYQETKAWYHHRIGKARYMANAGLMSTGAVRDRITAAIREVF